MRLAAAIAVAGVVAAAGAAPCAACSCVPRDPRDMLHAADAAFVGVLVSKEVKVPPLRSSADAAVYTFRVEEKVKGNLRATVEVESPASSASCGLEIEVGARAGVLLQRRGDAWVSNMCSQLPAPELRAAARPLPRPRGRGPAALVVAGGFGEARVVAVDARGRTLAYGLGGGETTHLAMCPGGRRVVELAVGGPSGSAASRPRLAVRTVPRLKLVRSVAVPARLLNLRRQEVRAFVCGDGAARNVLVFARQLVEDAPAASTLFRARGRSFRVLYRGFAESAAIGRGRAYVTGAQGSTAVVAVDLRSGAQRRVATLPAGTRHLALSRNGRYLAGLHIERDRILRVRLGDGHLRTIAVPLQEQGATLAWTASTRLLFLPSPVGTAHVFDASLRRVGTIRGWSGAYAAVRGGRVYGVSFNGGIVSAPLPRGPVRSLRELPTRVVYGIASVG